MNGYIARSAGLTLGRHFIHRAHRLARDIGFGYWPCADAPDACGEGGLALLQAEFSECLRKRRAFRVWSGASDGTIYGSAEANYAFRFLHDVGHCVYKLGTTFDDEVQLARKQGREIEAAFGVRSPEALVYLADTEGQSTLHNMRGYFPEDQADFVQYVACELSRGMSMHTACRGYLACG